MVIEPLVHWWRPLHLQYFWILRTGWRAPFVKISSGVHLSSSECTLQNIWTYFALSKVSWMYQFIVTKYSFPFFHGLSNCLCSFVGLTERWTHLFMSIIFYTEVLEMFLKLKRDLHFLVFSWQRCFWIYTWLSTLECVCILCCLWRGLKRGFWVCLCIIFK